MILLQTVGTAAFALAQNPTDTPSTSPGTFSKPQADTTSAPPRQAGSAIPATLAKSVDSKKVKAGDPIEAKTAVPLTSNNLQIPHGSKILGHITEAKSKAKGDTQSTLAFAFDKIVLKDGKEVPFRAVAQAIGPQPRLNADAIPESEPAGPNSPNSGLRSAGVTRTPGDRPTPPTGNPSAADSGALENQTSNAAGLPSNAIGIVGIKGLTLTSQADTSTVSSDSKSVKLEEGSQLLLRFVGQ